MSAPLKEILKNNPTTTLNGNISNSTTSIVVTDGSVFPSTGNFRLICDSELMLCTARSTNTLTVVRGSEGTSAVAHNTLTPISQILTLAAMEAWGRDNDPMWASSRPALGKLVADDGSTILTASDFTAINAGSDVVSDQNGTILMRKFSQAGTGNQVHALVRSAPSTPYAYIACFEAMFALGATSIDRPNFGMILRESGTGKLISWELSSEGGTTWEPQAWIIGTHTSPTSAVTVAGGFGTLRIVNVSPRLWMRIEDDGTDLTYYFSPDGFNWLEIFTHSRTAHMAGGPDQIGWYANNYENGHQMLVRLCHWSKE